jgi:hypothetical protein
MEKACFLHLLWETHEEEGFLSVAMVSLFLGCTLSTSLSHDMNQPTPLSKMPLKMTYGPSKNGLFERKNKVNER